MRHSRLAVLALAGLLAACGAPDQGKAFVPEPPAADVVMPSEPVTLNIVDVAGNLQLTQQIFENYKAQHPKAVSKITYTKVTAPELAGKVKAQQDAGRLDIDLVLTGTDGLSAGLEQNLWVDLQGRYAGKTPKPDYLEPAAKMAELAQGRGVVITYYPSGPLIEYNPATVPNPPKTAEELLAWAKAHPRKLEYARPANSGPGRTFLMGLPYILKDSDPKDPVNGWSKTWRYLKDLGQTIEYYPSKTSQTMSELGDGTRDIVITTTGWDINPRVLGQVPKDYKVQSLEGFTWVTDAHYAVVPKGVSGAKLAVILDLLKFALTPQQQAITYDKGYFYPGPAVRGVTLDMAPPDSQQAIKEYGRPEYDRLIEDNPKAVPLDAKLMVTAFDTWDKEIGGDKVKTS
ncbi:extracellular solute-binding protein [Microbispora sp. ATCC PTA-5024]|uniref:extracellular solute-binding protein n=1 Tax=Microbispora sp. ATCC PTA-5024 TaxID=316330 RepID=UPI0003DC941A|nr:extracellular solute-binding protein [Microbispora sp. ATCC PTA-5024]ETK32098.1 ABC transporter substrate-binding protein [Microbispora sp. ATCC PTA-5024]